MYQNMEIINKDLYEIVHDEHDDRQYVILKNGQRYCTCKGDSEVDEKLKEIRGTQQKLSQKRQQELIDRFIELVRVYDGFCLEQVLQDGTVYEAGGEGNQFWFVETYKEETINHYVGYQDENGNWRDACIFRSGGYALDFDEQPGITIRLIIDKAFAHQDENWVLNRKPEHHEESLPYDHYVYGHDVKTLDISSEYYVTMRYTDCVMPEEGFEFGRILCGEDLRKSSLSFRCSFRGPHTKLYRRLAFFMISPLKLALTPSLAGGFYGNTKKRSHFDCALFSVFSSANRA